MSYYADPSEPHACSILDDLTDDEIEVLEDQAENDREQELIEKSWNN